MNLKPLALTLAGIFLGTGCKQVPHAGLSDYAPGKTEYTAEIVDARGYVRYDRGFVDTDDEKNGIKPDSMSAADLLRDIMSKPLSSGSDFNWRREWYESEIDQAGLDQLKYSINGLSQSEMGAAFSKMKVTSFEIPKQQTPPRLPFIEDPENYVEIKFSVSLTLQVPSERKVSTLPKSWAPLLVHENMNEEIYKAYRSCVRYQGDDPEFYKNALFYYFDVKRCDIENLNAKHKLMKPLQMTLKKVPPKVVDGGTPEYEHIWRDNQLVATFVFGVYEDFSNEKKIDAGTQAYEKFVSSLNTVKKLTKRNVLNQEKRNYRAIYDMRRKNGETASVDVQAIHLQEISGLSPDAAQKMFGNRIGKHDLFVYNGHSGYGHNIEHVQKLLQPTSTEYVLFFLNGCYTYSYNDLENDNLDVISNMKPSLFQHMAFSSLTMLKGLLEEESYKTILGRMPSYQKSIVSGEDRFCPSPKSP